MRKMMFSQTRKLIQDFLFSNNYLILLVIIKNQMINFKILRIKNKILKNKKFNSFNNKV